MANTVQIKRGNNTSVNAHTGPSGELIYNLDTGRLHAQDGSTAGGNPHALISDVDLKANADVNIIAGDGLTGGGTLAANRTLALSSASIASLSLADTAVQTVNGKSGSAVVLGKGDIGLGNVDNTSDASKPISTATQTALNAKANSAITVTAGSGLTGGGNLTANRTVALNAASIASLGKADTALQAPGGSAGQILAKNSATTNDVVWVSSEAATAVSYGPQTLTDAQQGQARANIGAGVLSGFRNKIINGGFDIWQRGITFNSAAGYTADRWAAGQVSSLVNVTRGDFPPGFSPLVGEAAYFLSAAVTNAGSGAGAFCRISQFIEGVRTLAGKKATLTFVARCTAGSGDITAELSQVFGSGGATAATGIGATKFTLDGTFKKYQVVVDIPSIEGKVVGTADHLGVNFWLSAGSNLNDRTQSLGLKTGTFHFAHVSLVEGDATAEDDPFEPRHIQQELALCQRYYESASGIAISGYATSGISLTTAYSFKQTKRVSPTGVGLYFGSNTNATSASMYDITTQGVSFGVSTVETGGITCRAMGANFDAEL